MTPEEQNVENIYRQVLGDQAVSLIKLNAKVAGLIQHNAELTAQLVAKTKELTAIKTDGVVKD